MHLRVNDKKGMSVGLSKLFVEMAMNYASSGAWLTKVVELRNWHAYLTDEGFLKMCCKELSYFRENMSIAAKSLIFKK